MDKRIMVLSKILIMLYKDAAMEQSQEEILSTML